MSSDDDDGGLPDQPLPGETRETLADGRVRITSATEPGAELFARRCVLCVGLFYEERIARHFDACFTAHSPSAPPAVVRQPTTAADPERALFGTIFEDSQDGAWRFRLHSLRRSVYMSALPIDCLLSFVGPAAYGRLSQVSAGWRDVTRTARPLRQWHHEQNTRLLGRLVRGEHCTCASIVRQLAEGASREVCGKAAASLERGLALREVEVFVKNLSGRPMRLLHLASRGEEAPGVLLEATLGDVLRCIQDIEGLPVDQHANTLHSRSSSKALHHMEAPLIVAWNSQGNSARQINLEMTLPDRRGGHPCFFASLQHWDTHMRRERRIEVSREPGQRERWQMEAEGFIATML